MDGSQFVDRHDSSPQDITLGEVYRKLSSVHEHVLMISGRVHEHEAQLAVLRWATGLIGVAALAVFGAMLAKVW